MSENNLRCSRCGGWTTPSQDMCASCRLSGQPSLALQAENAKLRDMVKRLIAGTGSLTECEKREARELLGETT